MGSEHQDETLDAVVVALSASGDDALSKAAQEGFLDRPAVVEWAESVQRLVFYQRDPARLRAELPALAQTLLAILRQLPARNGIQPESVVGRFLWRLPAVRTLVAEDVEAAFERDPAAKSYAEIVAAYPSLWAIAAYRIAHELHSLGAPLVPRIMTEHAHARTGIDIHPGARIGRRFFIDHGTGVVIGETCEIGDRVVLYQGVTLGALSTHQVESLRGRKRHPTLEDDVTIYAGATILGGNTVIGRGCVIGGNVWLTKSVPSCSKVQIEAPRLQMKRDAECEEQGDQLHWDI